MLEAELPPLRHEGRGIGGFLADHADTFMVHTFPQPEK